jgi:hypothetical protein
MKCKNENMDPWKWIPPPPPPFSDYDTVLVLSFDYNEISKLWTNVFKRTLWGYCGLYRRDPDILNKDFIAKITYRKTDRNLKKIVAANKVDL